MRSKPLQMLLVAILLASVAAAAKAEDKKDNPAPPAGAALSFPGRIDAAEQVGIQPRVAAAVAKVNVDIGDRVKKGQVLMELTAPELQSDFEEAEARLVRAKAEVEQAEAAVQAAKAKLSQSRAALEEAQTVVAHAKESSEQAKAKAGQFEKPGRLPFISKDEYEATLLQAHAADAAAEEAEAHAKAAEAARDAAAAEIARAEAALKAAQAGVAVAEVGVRRAQTRLEYTTIEAPFDGIVTRRLVDAGATVGPPVPGETAPLLTVMRDDPVIVAIDVDERSAPRVTVGAPVVVNVQSLAEAVKAKVTRTAGAFNPDTGTMRVEINLPNPDGKLRPGMFVTVQVKPGDAGK